jgi:hypothetical protein
MRGDLTKRHAGWAVIGMLVAAIVLGQLYTILAIRTAQIENTERAKDTASNTNTIKAVAEAIESCTTPTGECSKRNAKGTAAAVGQIGDAQLYVVACALQTRDPADATSPELRTVLRQIRACVMQARAVDQR